MALVAVALLALIAGMWTAFRPGPVPSVPKPAWRAQLEMAPAVARAPDPEPPVAAPEPTPVVQAQPSAQKPQASGPPAGSAATVNSSASAAALRELRDTARGQLARGERQEALSTLSTAFALAPADAQLRRILNDAIAEARAEAAQARTMAAAAGAAGATRYQDSDASGLEASRLERTGPRLPALALWWLAAEGYATASRDAQSAAPNTKPSDAAPASADTRSEEPRRSAAEEARTTAGDERAVRATLQVYAAAAAGLDVDGVKRVFPGVNEPALRQTFGAVRSQTVEIQGGQMSVAGDTATVSCTLVTSVVGQADSAVPQRDSRRVVFSLVRRNGNWIIIDRR